MNLTKYVACICEGAAEKAIMEILLDADKLIFKRDDLLEGELLRCRSGKNFEEQHLRKGFTEKITVLRILDSRREQFRLSKAYESCFFFRIFYSGDFSVYRDCGLVLHFVCYNLKVEEISPLFIALNR